MLEQIANFGEEFLIHAQFRHFRFGCLLLLGAEHPSQELLDEDEQREGDDQEVDDLTEKFSVGNFASADFKSPVLVPLIARHDRADEGHENVLHEGFDNFSERSPDDYTDRQVDDISLERERFEFIDPAERLAGRGRSSSLRSFDMMGMISFPMNELSCGE